MNPTAIYSKSGKGVQEASGKTSLLKRPDRAVLSAIDGRATLDEVAQKVGRRCDGAFLVVIQQLDKDGFIREVSAGTASAAPLAPPSRPAPAKPLSKPASMDPASDLDFSSLGSGKGPVPPPQRMAMPSTPSRPAAPTPPPPKPSAQQLQQAKAQQSALDRAREEAEAKAAAERERVKREAEEKAKAEIEAKMRADAEAKAKAAAAAEAEAKVKAAREAAVRAAAEAKARAEAEAKAKAEAERKAQEERRAREEMERRLEAERKARIEEEAKRQEAERKAREEAERARREAEEKARREAEELRQRLEAERKAREEAERKAREEAERMRRELEAERQRLEEARRKEEEERAARKRRDEEEDRQRAEQRQREDEERERRRQQAAAAPPPEPLEPPKAPATPGGFADSLMADLDSFTNNEEEEQKAREAADRQTKAEAERRRQEEAQRLEAEREAAEARRRRDEEARRQEEEARQREEERRKREADEIRRKAEAATVAARAKQATAQDEDIPIGDDDLDMDEVKQERQALGIDEKKQREKQKEAEREAKRKQRADEKRRREAEKQAARAPLPGAKRPRRSSSWGRPMALLLAIVLVVAIGAAHIMPLDTAPYEQAATEALGQPVRIGSARLWLFTGVQLRFDGVRVGDTRVGRVVTHPALGALFGERKHFNLVELEGVSAPQSAFGAALFSRLKPGRFSVERIVARNLELKGGLVLPKLDAEVALARDGTLRSATLHGPDGLYARITPRSGSAQALEFEATAAGFPLPIGPQLTLSQFAMKGTATHRGLDIAEWGGAIFNGGISGTAKLRWGNTWDVDGVVTVRAINAAVFAPALLSQGNAEGTGRFSMSSADPAKLLASSRVDGRFSVSKGTLGSFDLSRAIQSRGKQAIGTTQFSELSGQGSYDRGTVALRNVTIGAGALNAGASAEISKNGALSGRIVADVKTAAQTLSATLNLGGTVKEPQVRD